MADEVQTVFFHDGTETQFLNHEAEVAEGVLILSDPDGSSKTIYPLTSIHHYHVYLRED